MPKAIDREKQARQSIEDEMRRHSVFNHYFQKINALTGLLLNPETRKALVAAMKRVKEYQENVAFGDMEFEQAVGGYLDDQDKQYADAQKADFVPLNYPATLSGYNTIGGSSHTVQVPPDMHPEGKESITFPEGRVFALHAKNANPALWAHEFRHESPYIKSNSTYWYRKGRSEAPNPETLNRYEDLFHAQTPRDMEAAIDLLADTLYLEDKSSGEVKAPWYYYKWAEELAPMIIKQMQDRHENGRRIEPDLGSSLRE